MNKPTTIIIGLLIAAALFYGGYSYGSMGQNGATLTASRSGRTGSTTASFAGYSGLGGGGATTGTVVSKDATSITIALKSGSVVVFYATSTPIMKTTSGAAADIETGANITVIGTTNSDGSVTASSIQIRPSVNQ